MLQKQCDRWVREKNVVALETLSKALVKLPLSKTFDSNYVHLSTMKVYGKLVQLVWYALFREIFFYR